MIVINSQYCPFRNLHYLKQPSIIFLTNFFCNNLFFTVILLGSVVVTTATGEWVFGVTDNEKNTFCQFVGFVTANGICLTKITFTIVS